MSIEIYIQAHFDGDEQFIENDAILAVIRKRKSTPSNGCHLIEFDERNSIEVFFANESSRSSSIVVSRPCEGRDFHHFIYELMGLGNCILLAPDGKFPIILNKNIKNHLPEGMIDGLGKPKVGGDFPKFCALMNQLFV